MAENEPSTDAKAVTNKPTPLVVGIRLNDGAGPVDEVVHGFAKPAATLVLRLQGGADDPGGEAAIRELTIRIGAKADDNEAQRYLTRDGFGFTGTVWESAVRRLLEDTLYEVGRT